MNDSGDRPYEDWVRAALALNRERRARRFAQGQAAGMAWLVECRDLWDADDEDAGVYFKGCATPEEVEQLAAAMPDEGYGNRILGIYDLARPLKEQGAGLTRSAWLERYASRR